MFTVNAYSSYDTNVDLSDVDLCVKAAMKKHPGHIVSMESEIENDRLIYEFDIVSKSGHEIEIECDAKKHTLHDFETELPKGDMKFADAAKLSEDEAKKIALTKVAGKVVDTEYAMENNIPAYEFDILASDGYEYEIEVNALTGEITEVEKELYDIGQD